MGLGEDWANGRAKPSRSGKVSWFASVSSPDAARLAAAKDANERDKGAGCAVVLRKIPS